MKHHSRTKASASTVHLQKDCIKVLHYNTQNMSFFEMKRSSQAISWNGTEETKPDLHNKGIYTSTNQQIL